MPSLSSWVAPTLSVEEVDKRIQELKTVQYWLEQNGHALKATIQALEVQKMTLSTLRGMNVRMEDLANAFTRRPRRRRPPAAAAAPAPRAQAPAPEPEPRTGRSRRAGGSGRRPAPKRGAKAKTRRPPPRRRPPDGGVVDPLQWWGALTQQFQQIASSALQDASQMKMPAAAQPLAEAVGQAMGAPARAPARKATTAAKKAPAAAKKTTSAQASARALISNHVCRGAESMKLFPTGHATHPQWRMAAGLVLAQLRAQMALPDYAHVAHAGPALHHRPLRGRGAGDPRPPGRRAARDHRLVRHRRHRRSANNAEYFDEPALCRDAVQLPSDQYRVFSGVAPLAGSEMSGFAAAHGAGACRPAARPTSPS